MNKTNMKNRFKKVTAIFLMLGAGSLALAGCDGISIGGKVVEDTVDLKDFDSVNIDVSSVDVTFTRGDSFQLTYRTHEQKVPVVTEENGTLTVKQTDAGLSFSPGQEDIYRITVPENYDGEIELTLQASAGDINIGRLNVSGDVTTGSGDVALSDLEGDRLAVKVDSGDVRGENIKTGQITFTATSGDIEIKGLRADKCHSETASGDLQIKGSEIRNADCVVRYGDVEINDSVIETAVCDSAYGDVEIELHGADEAYSYKLDTSFGDITVNGQRFGNSYKKDGGAKSISAHTDSGDIEVSVQ